MQRIATGVLVLLAVAFSAGGVAIGVRADSAGNPAATAPQESQCNLATPAPVHVNEAAAERAAKDDVVPLNTQGYNYDSYDNQWRPNAPEHSDPIPGHPPAAPAKP